MRNPFRRIAPPVDQYVTRAHYEIVEEGVDHDYASHKWWEKLPWFYEGFLDDHSWARRCLTCGRIERSWWTSERVEP